MHHVWCAVMYVFMIMHACPLFCGRMNKTAFLHVLSFSWKRFHDSYNYSNYRKCTTQVNKYTWVNNYPQHSSKIYFNKNRKLVITSFLDIVPILINSCLPLLHKIYALRKNILAVQQAVHAPLLVFIENWMDDTLMFPWVDQTRLFGGWAKISELRFQQYSAVCEQALSCCNNSMPNCNRYFYSL